MSEDSSLGLFLNLESRAQCNGTVTAYHYCYYDPNTNMMVVVFFMVFRESGSVYNLVEGSHMKVTRKIDGSGCDVLQLDETQQFQVQENDIIAACTVNLNGRAPLRVHANSTQGHTLQKLDIDSCSVTEVNTIAGTMEAEFALHLFAEIGEFKVTSM